MAGIGPHVDKASSILNVKWPEKQEIGATIWDCHDRPFTLVNFGVW